MNHECHGDLFRANTTRYYRCFGDGSIVEAVNNGDACPSCQRTIDAVELGEVKVKELKKVVAMLPNGEEIDVSQGLTK